MRGAGTVREGGPEVSRAELGPAGARWRGGLGPH